MDSAYLWLALATPIPLLTFLLDYRRVIRRKRAEANDLIKLDGARRIYMRQYGGEDSEPRALVLFNETYGGASYIFPTIALIIATSGWTLVCLSTLTHPGFIPLPRSGLFGAAGAYVWAVTVLCRLRRLEDLAPQTVHAIWIHVFIAPFIASLASVVFVKTFDVLTGFGIGVLPLRSLIEWITTRARTTLGIGNDSMPAEAPNMQHLQGAAHEVVTRLADEGFMSISHVAYADPIRMMLVTGLERKVLIDLMDQALLYMYIGDGVQKTRGAGLRGAIEGRELHGQLIGADETQRQRGEETVSAVAKSLELDVAAVRNLVKTLYIDAQAELLHHLWSMTFDLPADEGMTSKKKREEEDADPSIAALRKAATPPSGADAEAPKKGVRKDTQTTLAKAVASVDVAPVGAPAKAVPPAAVPGANAPPAEPNNTPPESPPDGSENTPAT